MKHLLPGLFILMMCYSSSAKQGFSMDQRVKISKSVTQLLNEISMHNMYEYQTVGIAGKLSEQYQRFEKLENMANVEELIYISKMNKNAVVRLYAYQGLKRKGVLIPKDLQEQFKNDLSEIQTLNGRFGTIFKVNQLSEENINCTGSTTQFQNKLK